MSHRSPFRTDQLLARATQQDVAGRGGAIVYGVVIAVALFGALFPWFPGGLRLSEGSTAERAILAPRSATYESEVLTEQVREDAATAVDDVLVLDTGIREQQLAQLERILGRIREIRDSETLAASAKESAIRQIEGTDLSQRSAAAFIDASDAQWNALAEEARTVLSRTLTGTIRPGEVSDARQRAAGLLSALLTADQVLAITELLNPLIVPTLVVDQERTEVLREEARANTPPVRMSFERGAVVIPAGRQLTAADVEALEQLGIRTAGIDPAKVAATGVFSALVGAGVSGYLILMRPATLRGIRRLTLFALLLLVPALAAKFALPLVMPDFDRHFFAMALPIAAGPIAAAVLLEVGLAVLLTTLLGAIAAYITVYLPAADAGGDLAQLETARMALVVIASSLAGVYFTARADRLQRYLVGGTAAAVASAAVLLSFWLLDADRRIADLLWMGAAAAVSGLLAALIAVGSFVLLSRPFGIITRVELMELAQLSHPLLRRLQDEAPGTFQHSILVGNLAERAADRIGANPLLVRVGAYYHDIGKLVAPSFFVENMPPGEPSPHEGLDPLQSTRVIQQHVTGGVELARREHLPAAVAQFIPQHHGTRLVAYFYRRAAEHDPEIDEDLFRYPGPRPQSRETALVMLADSCEATVRASADRSTGRIREIVEATIKERIDEGQFDECDISLRDLRIVAETFTASLAAVFHPRVEYPQPSERELAQRRAIPLPDQGARPRLEAPRERGRSGNAAPDRPAERRRESPRGEDEDDGLATPPPRERPAQRAGSTPPRAPDRELSEDDT